METPRAANLYRFIPADRHEEFGARQKNGKAPELAQFFELKVPQRQSGLKWFSYVAQVICAMWTNQDRIDDRKVILLGMRKILELRTQAEGFVEALNDHSELKALLERPVTQLAADPHISIGDLAKELAAQLERITIDHAGVPHCPAPAQLSDTERAVLAELDACIEADRTLAASCGMKTVQPTPEHRILFAKAIADVPQPDRAKALRMALGEPGMLPTFRRCTVDELLPHARLLFGWLCRSNDLGFDANEIPAVDDFLRQGLQHLANSDRADEPQRVSLQQAHSVLKAAVAHVSPPDADGEIQIAWKSDED